MIIYVNTCACVYIYTYACYVNTYTNVLTFR